MLELEWILTGSYFVRGQDTGTDGLVALPIETSDPPLIVIRMMKQLVRMAMLWHGGI